MKHVDCSGVRMGRGGHWDGLPKLPTPTPRTEAPILSAVGDVEMSGAQLNPSAGTAFGRGKLLHPELQPCPRDNLIQ